MILPDGAKFEMAWKHIRYINHDNFIVFQIVPMYIGKGIVMIPNMVNRKKISDIFPIEEREEIIFFIRKIKLETGY